MTTDRTESKRVLVVDDEDTVRHVVRQVLEEQGCEVVDAGSAEEGLSLIHGIPCDVAMLDIVLPGMNGIELLRAITSVSPQTQVVMMTSHASLETSLDALRHGAYAYLQKPFEELDLIWSTVSRALEKRELMGLLEQREFELRKAGDASRAKSEFLSVIGHELRTPLNAILGYADLLGEEAETLSPDELRTDLRKIHLAAERLLHQINDVLEVSRIDSGTFEADESAFDPRAVVDQIRVRSSRAVEAKGLRLEISTAPDVPADVVGAPRVIAGVLNRIVDNAIKFTDTGAIAIRVSRGTDASGSPQLRFEVEDSGIGIPAEARDRVFDAFRQADSSRSRSHEGVGLGLTLAKRWVDKMGGTIDYRDNPGPGATFWISLPLVSEAAHATEPA